MRIYIDTSVVGGVFDQEFQKGSQSFFENVDSGDHILVVSELLRSELLDAPERVRTYLDRFKGNQIEEVKLDIDILDLADFYVSERVVGATSLADCQHIAAATVYRADALVSWNFKHIVNLRRIRGYNAVNLKHGHPMIEIRTPIEVLEI